jgi:hypothetical protein
MYPAEYYGSLFDFEDLPDVIIAPDTTPYPKLGEPTILPSVNAPDVYTVFYGFVNPSGGQSSGESIGILASSPNQWFVHQDAAASPRSACLFDDKTQLEEGWFDDFEDAYTVSLFFADGGLFQSDSYTRRSLCEWIGESVNERVLIYDSDPNSPYFLKWVTQFDEAVGTKDDPQNSPVGEYPIPTGQSFFEGGKIVIE